MSAGIGLIAGTMMMIWSISSAGNLGMFWDIPSIIITLGGSFCAILVSFPLDTLKGIPKKLKLLMVSAPDNREDLLILFTDLAKKVRADGLLALEEDIDKMDMEFLVSGLQMVIDGVESDDIRELMELKMDTMERRHRSGQSVFLKWSDLAPGFGMLGTLIGLIIMLVDLDDPSAIGVGMSVALPRVYVMPPLLNKVKVAGCK